VTIGRDVIISNYVMISDNDSHPVSPKLRREMSASDHDGELWTWKHAKSAPVTIEDNVWIGRRVLVTKGVTIGKGSIVAAGSVVSKSVPPYSLCFGNPCVIRAGIYEEADG
jgi:maltose O-acetyltransferase